MKALFVRYTESGNHALCMVRKKFTKSSVPVYILSEDVPGMTKGDTFEIPEDLKIVPMMRWNKETETKELATVTIEATGEIIQLMTLA